MFALIRLCLQCLRGLLSYLSGDLLILTCLVIVMEFVCGRSLVNGTERCSNSSRCLWLSDITLISLFLLPFAFGGAHIMASTFTCSTIL